MRKHPEVPEGPEMTTVDWIVFDQGGIVVPESGARIMARVARELRCPPERLAGAMRVYHDGVTTGALTLRQVYASILHDLSLDGCPDTVWVFRRIGG